MLAEMPAARREGEPRRRWFADDRFDLIVWLCEDSSVASLQLCYDKRGQERAVVWSREEGYSHFRVDSGDLDPTKNNSPVLACSGRPRKSKLLSSFLAAAGQMDSDLRDFIADRLRELPSWTRREAAKAGNDRKEQT